MPASDAPIPPSAPWPSLSVRVVRAQHHLRAALDGPLAETHALPAALALVREAADAGDEATRHADAEEQLIATRMRSRALLAACLLATDSYERGGWPRLEAPPGDPAATAVLLLLKACLELTPPVPGTATRDEPPPSPAPLLPLPLDAYPLERCAALAACLALRPAETQALLKAAELDPTLWENLRNHYAAELSEDQKRGLNARQERHDKAYYAALEEARRTLAPPAGPQPPLGVHHVARLRMAGARGNLADVCRECAVPASALPVLERVWLARTLESPELRTRLRSALEQARAPQTS